MDYRAKLIKDSSILCKKYKILQYLPVISIGISFILMGAVTLLLAATNRQVIDSYSQNELIGIRKEIASAKQGFASKGLEKYGNHYTMLAYRGSTGSAEIHENEVDVFMVQEGEAVLLTGGTMVGSHLQKAGELRGSSISGGEKRTIKVGDVIHIPAGVPHQLLVPAGGAITYFVVKIAGQ